MKRKYQVYLVRRGYGCYGSMMFHVGNTMAVSEAQAENNVRFRHNGAVPAAWTNGDCEERGDIDTFYKAFPYWDNEAVAKYKAELMEQRRY